MHQTEHILNMTGDIAAIWENFHHELRAFILGKTRNADDTDDILQDAFVRIINNWTKVSQAQNVRLYLYGIVRNTLYDHFRKQQPIRDTVDSESIFTTDEEQNLNTAVADCCIKPFIQKLPEHYREALLITEFQQVSQKELALRLGISYSGAKSRVQRGREQLKALLLSCCPYQSDVYGNIINSESDGCGCP